MRTINHWIDGTQTAGASTRVGPVYNPATGSQTAEVPLASTADVDTAVQSARRAFETWRYSSLTLRQNIMFAFRELVAARKLDIAKLLTAEHGKTIDDALGEVQRGLEVVEFACNIAHLLKGDFSEQVSTGVDTYTIRQPLGVVAGITPFNFPAMVPMWMYPLAIACGTPSSSSHRRRTRRLRCFAPSFWRRRDCPMGSSTSSMATRRRSTASSLIRISLPSPSSDRHRSPVQIDENGTRNGKRVQALGGAKNHMIVLPDADIDLAADSAVSAGYGSAGERCMAISAVLAVGEAGDRLIEGVQARIEKLKVGPGDEPGVEMGPLVTRAHLDRVRGYVDAGVAEGATLVADGRSLVVDGHADGFF